MNAIGVNTWVWVSPLTDQGLDRLVPFVASLGFGAIELPIENPGDWSPAHAAELIAEHSLVPTTCLVMPPGRELGAADADTVASTQAYLRDAIDIAASIGSRALCGPAYTSVGRTWRLDPAERTSLLDELATSLRPVADYGAEHGVRIALEPLNRFETSVINTVEQGLELVRLVDSPGLGLAYDTFHANIEEKDLGASIRAAGDDLVHVQVCGNDRGAPGHDHIDWIDVRDALADVGYDDPICIESFTAENQIIATAASIWRSFEGTQDAIAVGGLAFLHTLFASSAPPASERRVAP